MSKPSNYVMEHLEESCIRTEVRCLSYLSFQNVASFVLSQYVHKRNWSVHGSKDLAEGESFPLFPRGQKNTMKRVKILFPLEIDKKIYYTTNEYENKV